MVSSEQREKVGKDSSWEIWSWQGSHWEAWVIYVLSSPSKRLFYFLWYLVAIYSKPFNIKIMLGHRRWAWSIIEFFLYYVLETLTVVMEVFAVYAEIFLWGNTPKITHPTHNPYCGRTRRSSCVTSSPTSAGWDSRAFQQGTGAVAWGSGRPGSRRRWED